MKNFKATVITALSLAVATLAHGQDPSAMLAQCMKMPPGTPEQNNCIVAARAAAQAQAAAMKAQAAAQAAAAQQAAAARQAAAAQQAAAAAQAMARQAAATQQSAAAAQTAAAKAQASMPPPKTAEVPPDVKKAAEQLGLAGKPATGIVGGSKVAPTDISNMDIQVALAMIQAQQAALTESHMKEQLGAAQDRAAQMAATKEAADKLKAAAQAQTSAAIAQAIISLGSGVAGMNAIKGMKSAGLDTSKIKESTINGATTYSITKAQADAYSAQLDGQMKQAQAEQLKQSAQMQDAVARNKQAYDTMQKFIQQMQQAQAQIIGNMH